ncbi:MAG: tripartite tricarboxylate transporter substrate binding protein [Polaromonas sp.]
MRRRTFTLAAAASLAAPMIRAQTLPSVPVRIIVGAAPGGGTDLLARLIGQKLALMWNVQILIENKPGATSMIAADYVAKQPGDGATLLMAHINSHAIAPALFPKMTYDVHRDFAPIALVGVTPNLLICNEHQAARTVQGLVELCRQKPNTVSFGSSGTGSAQHLALEMFKLAAKVQAIHIPYKGSAPMLTDLIGGQINYSFDTMTAATPHVKSGKAIAIAQTRLVRAKGYPNVPTMAESGFPGFDATTWYGMMGPRTLPLPLARRMNEDINKVLAMPEVVEKFEQIGAEDGGGSIEKFSVFLQSETKKWAKVVKDANVKMDS